MTFIGRRPGGWATGACLLWVAAAVGAPGPKDVGPAEYQRKADQAVWVGVAGMDQVSRSVEASGFKDRGEVRVARLAEDRRPLRRFSGSSSFGGRRPGERVVRRWEAHGWQRHRASGRRKRPGTG